MEDKIAQVAADLTALQNQVNNMTYVKSITMDDKGVLTITPSSGSAISYDAAKYVKYNIEVKNGNEIYVNGEKVGTITIDVADPTISVVNNELLVNGKSQNPKVMLPEAAVAPSCVSIVKDKDGNIVSVTLKDGENEYVISTSSALASLVFIPQSVNMAGGILSGGFQNQIPVNVITAYKTKYNATLDLYEVDYADNGSTSLEAAIASTFASVTGDINAAYRVNPSNVDITKPEWSLVARTYEVTTRAAEGDITNLFNINEVTKYGAGALKVNASLSNPISAHLSKEGVLTVCAGDNPIAGVKYDGQGQIRYNGFFSHVSLCGYTMDEKDNKVEVYSDPAVLVPSFRVARLENLKDVVKDDVTSHKNYPYDDLVEMFINDNADNYDADAFDLVSDIDYKAHHEIVYDAKVKTNLYDLAGVRVHDNAAGKCYTLDELGYTNYEYKFYNMPYNGGTDDPTDQSKFIKIEKNGDITVLQGTAAIGRTPIVYVQVVDKTTHALIANGYIKLQIKKDNSAYVFPEIDLGTFNYNELFDNATSTEHPEGYKTVPFMTWQEMNKHYEAMGLSHDEFKFIYRNVNCGIMDAEEKDYDWTLPTTAFEPLIKSGNWDVDTYVFAANLTPYSKFGENVFYIVFDPTTYGSDIRYDRKLVFKVKYTVVEPKLAMPIVNEYQYGKETAARVTGYEKNNSFLMEGAYGQPFYYGVESIRKQLGEDNFASKWVKKMVSDSKFSLTLAKDYSAAKAITMDGTAYNKAGDGVKDKTNIDEILGHLDADNNRVNGIVLGLNYKLDTPEEAYDLTFTVNYVNGEKATLTHTFVFVNPLSIVADQSKLFLTDFKDGKEDKKDFSKYISAKMFSNDLYKEGVMKDTKYGSTIKFELVPVENHPAPYVTKVNTTDNDGNFMWKRTDLGNALTKETVPAKVKVTFETNFAKVTGEYNITVKPEVTAGE